MMNVFCVEVFQELIIAPSVMMHEFEKQNIQRRLDTNISEEEIEAYYQKNIDNFELKQNIIRGYFIQLPKDAPKLGRFRYLLRSNRPDHIEELKSYAYSYGTKVHLNDSLFSALWLAVLALILPFCTNSCKSEYIYQ